MTNFLISGARIAGSIAYPYAIWGEPTADTIGPFTLDAFWGGILASRVAKVAFPLDQDSDDRKKQVKKLALAAITYVGTQLLYQTLSSKLPLATKGLVYVVGICGSTMLNHLFNPKKNIGRLNTVRKVCMYTLRNKATLSLIASSCARGGAMLYHLARRA